MAYHKWSRHSPRNHRSPGILEQQERNREEEYQRQALEHYKKSEAGKVVIREARANGVPLAVHHAGAAHETAYLVDVGASGRPVIAAPGFTKEAKEFPVSWLDKAQDWTLENATPAILEAWELLKADRVEFDKQAHEAWTKRMAEQEEEHRRREERFRSSD